jgi:hypothetical protein
MKSKIYVRYKNGEDNLIETLDCIGGLWLFLQRYLNICSTAKDFENFQCLFGSLEDKRLFILKLTKAWRFKIFPFGRILADYEVDDFFDLSKDTRLPITTVVV